MAPQLSFLEEVLAVTIPRLVPPISAKTLNLQDEEVAPLAEAENAEDV